jgi:phosphoribosyl 1,2-cyclic phosphodiesterase
MSIEVTFWGVRGSHPTWGPGCTAIGGHTSCIALQDSPNQITLLDAGSGLIPLGHALASQQVDEINIFITHYHIDHLLGLMFFTPLWTPGMKINFYAPCAKEGFTLEQILKEKLFCPPLFPVHFNRLPSQCNFHYFDSGDQIRLSNGAQITMIPLNHPGGCIGYRYQQGDQSLCYLTDHEHDETVNQESLAAFCHQSNLLVFDATYTPHDLEQYKGWGHSTWQAGVQMAKAAQVHRLALYHLNPTYTDQQIFAIESQAQQIFSNTFVAKERMRLTL